MKKILYSVMALAIAAMTFTACEDVPAPYDTPNGGSGNGSGSLPYASANLNTGWTLVEVTAGAQPWSKGSSYAQATGYQAWDGASQKSNKAAEGWLVSPAISTVGYENVKLSFNQTIRYTNNVTGWEANHKVYASTDYNGSTATWTELDFTPVASPYSDWTLYSSGEIQLPAEFVGKETVYIGFWFKAPATASTTWELQSFKMEEGIAEGTPTPEPQPTEELGTADAPLTVAKALEIINGYADGGASSGDAYVKGIIVSVQSYNSNYKSITYYISDDGTATNQLQVYSGKNLNNSDFTSADQLKVDDEVIVYGQLMKYKDNSGNIIPEVAQGNYLVKTSNTGGGEQPGGGGEAVTSLTNGDFETWADGLPTGWKSASTASSATLTQSTDAHGGSYSVNVNGKESSNVRLATQEITLAAGTYVFSFYAKATTADKAQCRAGYVPVTNGSVGNYTYSSEYPELNNTGWTQVSYEFTLNSETTVCLLVMNPKKSNYSSGKDILVDDATLTKK